MELIVEKEILIKINNNNIEYSLNGIENDEIYLSDTINDDQIEDISEFYKRIHHDRDFILKIFAVSIAFVGILI